MLGKLCVSLPRTTSYCLIATIFLTSSNKSIIIMLDTPYIIVR